MDNLASSEFAVIDTHGEMNVGEIAPVVGYRDVLDIGIREMGSDKVIGAIEPADINTVRPNERR